MSFQNKTALVTGGASGIGLCTVKALAECPGPTDTPLLRSEPEKFLDAFVRAIPMRRFGKPSEVADAIVFMASNRADYITGQVLSVNGGLAMVG